MMYSTTPDEWVLIHLTGDQEHYRVFCSWRSEFLTGESWRVNSGITNVTEDDVFYYFTSVSGSIYRCAKNSYGINCQYNKGVLDDMREKSKGWIHLVSKDDIDIMNTDWRL